MPYNIVIECVSVSSKTNGANFVQFRIMVEDENVQRMVIGKKGQNINWVRDHFKTNYAKLYSKEIEVHVRVVIRKKLMMKETEEIESSCHRLEADKNMEFMKKDLNDHLEVIT